MPCKIKIKENITRDIEARAEEAENRSLSFAQSVAAKINKIYGTRVIRYEQNYDYIDREIVVPPDLVDKYYENELKLEQRAAEAEARAVQEEDAKRAGEEYTDQYLYQLPGVESSKASPQTLAKVKEAAVKMGIKFQSLEEYIRQHPEVDVTTASGVADLLRGAIAIAEGREEYALTEEVVHMATAIIEEVNPALITDLISKIDRFKIYNKVLNVYRNNKHYQLNNGKPNILPLQSS